MKKYAKEFAVLLLLLSLILFVSIGAFTVNAVNTSTVTQVSSPLSYTQQDIFPAMKITREVSLKYSTQKPPER